MPHQSTNAKQAIDDNRQLIHEPRLDHNFAKNETVIAANKK